MTASALAKQGALYLKKNHLCKGVTLDHALEADLLLAETLGLKRIELLLNRTLSVSPDQTREYQALLARRARHEPVAYLLGHQDFFGLTFKTRPGALIPRPETELLVELTLEHLNFCHDRHALIDVGTGTGAIAAALASHSGESVLATELSPLAATLARENFKALGLAERIALIPGNGITTALGKRACKEARELIVVANLPYLTTSEWQKAQPDIRDFEPREALDGGSDGLDLYRVLLNQLEDVPQPIILIAEIDPSQKETLPQEIQKRFPDAFIAKHQDLSGRDRVILAKVSRNL